MPRPEKPSLARFRPWMRALRRSPRRCRTMRRCRLGLEASLLPIGEPRRQQKKQVQIAAPLEPSPPTLLASQEASAPRPSMLVAVRRSTVSFRAWMGKLVKQKSSRPSILSVGRSRWGAVWRWQARRSRSRGRRRSFLASWRHTSRGTWRCWTRACGRVPRSRARGPSWPSRRRLAWDFGLEELMKRMCRVEFPNVF